jgi:light-regulated signal transduction histidine kinase (bacteriophytochrome)
VALTDLELLAAARTARRGDLLGCADEPIRVPGAVQPHGALLAVREPSLEVVVASANAPGLFGARSPASRSTTWSTPRSRRPCGPGSAVTWPS